MGSGASPAPASSCSPARQYIRLTSVLDADEHIAVKVAYVIYQKIIAAYAEAGERYFLACIGDLFGVGDDDDLTDEGVFHGGVKEKIGDVCAGC